MTVHKVSTLEGERLDTAVALALGYRLCTAPGTTLLAWEKPEGGGYWSQHYFRPSSLAYQAEDIIRKQDIRVCPVDCGFRAYVHQLGWGEPAPDSVLYQTGGTREVAAMRALVAGRFGAEVTLP